MMRPRPGPHRGDRGLAAMDDAVEIDSRDALELARRQVRDMADA